jgi:hypothetical protein
MGDIDDGLALRAQVDVFKGIIGSNSTVGPVASRPPEDGGKLPPPQGLLAVPRPVIDILTTQLASGVDQRVKNALQIIAELKIESMGPALAQLMEAPDPAMQRRAVSVLGQVGSHAADERLLALLKPTTDEKLLKVTVETVTNLELNAFDQLLPLLDHPSFAVRDTAEHQITAHAAAYTESLMHYLYPSTYAGIEIGNPRAPVSPRALRSLIRIWTAMGMPFMDPMVVSNVEQLLADVDPGVRLEARRLATKWMGTEMGKASPFYEEIGRAAANSAASELVVDVPQV